MSFKDLPTGKR